MALRTARCQPGGRAFRQIAGAAGAALIVVLAGGLGACSPIAEWRSLRGLSHNDPDPKTAPFTQNMATADAAPYPNLASVPPPPTLASSAAERQRLTQSLIAERSATAADASPLPTPGAKPPAAISPATPPAAASVAAAGGTAPAPAPAVASSASPPLAGRAAPPSAAPSPSQKRPAAAQASRRGADEPPVPGSLNASLQVPRIAALPQPEAVRPPPPPPVLPAFPATAPMPPLPAAMASAMPAPAPPPPALAPVAPPPAIVKPMPPPPAATTVATLAVPQKAARLDVGEQQQVARVAALYKERKAARVRVVAYAAAPPPGVDPLASYHAALDRAQAIARALAAAGVPAAEIGTQAAPAAAAQVGRVEIQLVP